MKHRLLFLLLVGIGLSAHAQNWSTFLDPSRAINWSAGFTIPSYSTACPKQPTLATGSSNAAANSSSINSALASCTSTQNVVNLPAGTYYVTSINFGSQGHQVLRGAGSGTGSSATYLYVTSTGSCSGICMGASNSLYNGSSSVMPSSGSHQCSWTAGYAQGTTSITLSGCGAAPPVNQTLILDQANDSADTGGPFVCDDTSGSSGDYLCTYTGYGGGNADGRMISGVTHSQQQVVYTTGVTSLGSGSYTVTIAPGVYFTNVRSSQSPGAWWPGFVQNDGIENMTLNYSLSSAGTNLYGAVEMYNCYQCWFKGIETIDAGRDHVFIYQSAHDVVRDSYFYQSQSHSAVSYCVEVEESSDNLIENNIMQQVTNPIMFEQGAGNVIGYNLSLDDIFTSGLQASYTSHDAGSEMNLWEGNNMAGIWGDDAWGSSDQITLFRNKLSGWQTGLTYATTPVIMRAWMRNENFIGNILGQPGFHKTYQVYATSGTAGVGTNGESTAVYSLGYADSGGLCTTQKPACDAKTFSTTMRWGNWDVVNDATQWNATEASPAANAYINANFTSSYFSSLSQSLPASLYYSSTPSWWTSGKPWPPIGPDVASGNVEMCSTGSTYSGAMATVSGQCSGGSLTAEWASHVNSIPAQDCYLNTMSGPPDGTGSALNFSASACYGSGGTSTTQPASPSGLSGTPVPLSQ